MSEKPAESPKTLTEVLKAIPEPKRTPEERAALDEFRKNLGQAIVDNLNKNVREGRLTS